MIGTRSFIAATALLVTSASAQPAATQIQLEAPIAAPSSVTGAARADLVAEYTRLSRQLAVLTADLETHRTRCGHVATSDVARMQECQAATTQLGSDIRGYQREAAAHNNRIEIESGAAARDGQRIVRSLVSLARARNWPAAEVARLEAAFTEMVRPGTSAPNETQVRRRWQEMRHRSDQAALTAAAGTGAGPALFAAGIQRVNDCAVFALAAATGRPYGFIAAAAGQLVADAEYRRSAQRANPQSIFARNGPGGLNGGEILMLTEQFGRAAIVQPSEFPERIAAGRAVTVGVWVTGAAPGDLNRHQIVLSRTFQYNGDSWFEVIESNSASRLYLRHSELESIRYGAGIAYEPDPGATPALLR